MLGLDLAVDWWNRHNKFFGCTPEEVFEKDPEAVYRYLMSCAEGEW